MDDINYWENEAKIYAQNADYWRNNAEELEQTLDEFKKLVEDLDMLYPRAMKLMSKNKKFLVVADDEPYFRTVYNLIREHEKEIGRWSEEDEYNFLVSQVEKPNND